MGAPTDYYVDPDSGDDASGDGSSGSPWKTIQHALDNITQGADGDQINIKSGTADTLTAALDVTGTYGTPTGDKPLILRGYTSSADDGGEGEIDCDTYALFSQTTLDGINLIDLYIHGSRDGGDYLVNVDDYCNVDHCRIVMTSDGSWAEALYLDQYGIITGSYIKSAGDGVRCGANVRMYGCTLELEGNNKVFEGSPSFISHSIFVLPSSYSGDGIHIARAQVIQYCTIYCAGSGTGIGIQVADYGDGGLLVANNIIEGLSGAGGKGIEIAASVPFAAVVRNNAVYNCTTAIDNNSDDAQVRDNDILSSAPLTDPANDDFSIDGTQTDVTEASWPSTFLAMSTTDAADKGAVQAGAPTINPLRGKLG